MAEQTPLTAQEQRIGGRMSESSRRAMLNQDGPKPTPSAPKASGHPNDGAVVMIESGDSVTLTADLSDIRMVKGSTGKISGYCRVLVNGKAIGALTIYAPGADEADAAVPKAPRSIARDRDSGTDKLREMDRLFPLRGLSGDALIAQMVKRASLQVEADEYFARADAAQAKFDATVAANKGTWLGKSALDVLHWRETAGATLGAHDDSNRPDVIAARQAADESETA